MPWNPKQIALEVPAGEDVDRRVVVSPSIGHVEHLRTMRPSGDRDGAEAESLKFVIWTYSDGEVTGVLRETE